VKAKYIKRYGYAYECLSENNDRLMRIYRSECRKHDIMSETDEVFKYLKEFPDETELQKSLY
jgi:hypothetical protein